MIVIPYDDYNSRIPINKGILGTITSTIGHSALRNGWKIIEILEDEDLDDRDSRRNDKD